MSNFQLYKKAISATGTTTENEPIIKSDGASSNVMQWLSNNEASNITISEDGSNNLDLVVSSGNVGIGVAAPRVNLHVNDSTATSEDCGIIQISNYDTSFVDTTALGVLQFGGTRDNTNWGVGASISAEAAEAWDATGELGTDLFFKSCPIGSASLTTRLTISAAGLATFSSGVVAAAANGFQAGGAFFYEASSISRFGGSAATTRLYAAGAQAVDITATGLAVTGAVSPSGGVKFPATQSASADANTLDDYEEGTWTPALPNGGTLTVSYARYTRIGQQVTCHFYITALAPTANTSVFTIGGLPFTCSDVASTYPAGTIGYVGDGDWSAVGLVGSVNTETFKFHDLDGSNIAVTNNGAIAKWNGSVDEMLGQLTYIVK